MSSFSASWRIGLFVAAFLCGVNAIAQGDEYQQANNLFRAGQPAEALERLDNLLKAHPKDARGRFLKGLILTEQNKRADAIAVFIGLVQDYPELPEPYNNL
jgi:Flp pilus assembly protein TadD